MFAIRKIRNGKVKINKKWYSPREEYNGELDNMWYVFGLYVNDSSFVSLWGTKEMYFSEDISKHHGKTPDCINGIFYWTWWKEIDVSKIGEK